MSRTAPGGSRTAAYGLAYFAGILMITIGIFQVLEGIVALANDDFFVRVSNYTYDLDLTAWGWAHIIIGVVVGLIGIGVVTGSLLARIFAVFIVIFVMIDNFMFMPYYPIWSLLLLAMNGVILWALVTAE